MKVHGFRVYLELPPAPDKSIKLLPEAEAQLKKEMLSKMQKLKVYAIGDSVTIVQIGDLVMVDPSALNRSIPISLEEGIDVVPVSVHDIMHTW